MSKDLLKQLKHSDPEKRKAAIKGLAKAKYKDALVPLAKMGGDDRDPDVRELALKAGRYILEQTGGMADAAPKEGEKAPAPTDKKKAQRFHVDPKDEAQARQMLNAAMNYQLQGEKAKMMKTLSRALNLDPNLRYDSYFTSLTEDAIGLDFAEAVLLLDDEEMKTKASTQLEEARKQKHLDTHRSEVTKATWQDAVFDLAVFAMLVLVGLVVVQFIAVQSAQAYVERHEQNLLDWPRRECRMVSGKEMCIVPLTAEEIAAGQSKPRPITLSQPEPSFLEAATMLSETSVGTIVMRSVGAGLGGAVLVLLLSAVIHFTAAAILRGKGTFPYITHKAATLLTNRTLIVLALVGILSLLVMGSGGGIILTVSAGLLGLFGLSVVLTLTGLVGKAYDFGFVKGFAATFSGALVLAALGGGMGMLVL